MMADHTHFKTKDKIIFTTRGFYHPLDKIRAIPLYRPSPKEGNLEKSVDEFGDKWFYQLHSEWIQESFFGRGIFVPVSEILEIYDPFKSKETISKLGNQTAIQIITFLERLGIKESDIGFLGSYLFNTGKKPKDVDLVVRGLDNLILIKKNFRELLKDVRGKNFPSVEYIRTSIHRYEDKYNRDFNDFAEMITRRWPTIHVLDKFFGKLRFTYKKDEVPKCEIPQGNAQINFLLSGRVIEDLGTNFMPRYFQIETSNQQTKVLTYFWDFSYCVMTGDKVTIRGDYYPENKILLLSNPKQHGLMFKN